MKGLKISALLVSSLLSLSFVLVGCGSSSSDGGASSSSALKAEDVEVLGKNAASMLPGCVYSSENSLAPSRTRSIALEVFLNNYVLKDRIKTTHSARAVTRDERDIDETASGSCGGVMHTTGKHSNGNDDTLIEFKNYCTGNGSTQTTMNGFMSVYNDGHPTDNGPVSDKLKVSTKGDGLEIVSVDGSETTNSKLEIDDLVAEYGNPGGEATQSRPNTLKVDRIRVTDREGVYDMKNISMVSYDGATGSVTQVVNVTYVDPDIGSVSVSTTPMNNGKGSITVTSGGNSVIFTDSSGDGLFSANYNGEEVGALDCPVLAETADSI